MSTMAENERLDGLIGNGIRLVNQRCKFESMMDDTLSVRRRILEHDKKDIHHPPRCSGLVNDKFPLHVLSRNAV